ncbi:alpha/beta-hydrolase [Zopfia rhizophila CBS 207.26]|uniref:Alpha/beta-hydrolase n=1 Tax=Zopfia rhizophila CBS 207.26 TaxID=1314779 RepID=A0A6A6DD63_9PEZI|nr:alpha/beta-hydrolase [Zopfia rhizophila CBS 207.26]
MQKTDFGEFRGKKGDGVVQYLGIKYGNLKDRLAVPEMVESYESEIIDATEPKCVAMDACEFEQNVLIQQSIDTPKSPQMSGREGLNLNITVPDTENQKALPVMVFIHGGGFLIGANWWPQYDPARFVKLSMETGSPVIAVNINYRLGVLGNLTSKELPAAGKFIHGFGGDPENVTAFGESAGAISTLNQLYCKEPLFKRAISMSGTLLMLKPLQPPTAEAAYFTVMKELGLENGSAEERIQKLDELVAKTPITAPLMPFLDGDVILTTLTFEKLLSNSDRLDLPVPGRQWCNDLMIGDAQLDGSVFMYMGLEARRAGIASAFCTSLANNLSNPAAVGTVLQAYNITPATSDDTAMQAILAFATDIAYYCPAIAYAQFWPGKTYYYQFNEPNPWDGPFKGSSTHMLDAAFLFQNYNEKLSVEAREVAVSLARDFIKFANGIAPWGYYDGDTGSVKTFGPGGTSVSGFVERNGWGNSRRDTLFRLKEEGKADLDELSLAWDKFLGGQ